MKLYWQALFLLFLLAAVVILKFNHVSLPFYWDEAWAYGPAVYEMYHHGLSLLPDALPTDLSRGHPLLFHFSAALWMKIFGTGVFSLHCFAMAIALSLLVVIFQFAKYFLSIQTALMASLLMGVQSLFLAQASLLLPEMFLSLWIIVSLLFYLKGKYALYAISASCAMLTKETAVTLLLTVVCFHLIFQKKKTFNSLLLIVPFIPWIIFTLLQKHYHGWYFFPEHIGFLNFSIVHIADIMENYFSLIFIYYGRNIIFFTALAALIFVIIRKQWKNIFSNEISMQTFILLCVFMAVFICFGGINFYSDRYALPLLAPFLLCTSFVVVNCIRKKAVLYFLVSVFLFTGIYYSYSYETTSDHNLGYIKYCRTQKQCVDYFISNKWQDKNIGTTFLMRYYLNNPASGYVTEENKMLHVTQTVNDKTEIVVLLSSENDNDLEQFVIREKWTLFKIFSEKSAIIKVYKKV